MMAHEEDRENISFKVTDRRKFNPDGTVREGVSLDDPNPAPNADTAAAFDQTRADPDLKSSQETSAYENTESDLLGGSDLPGADDPASFVNFLSTIATNAAASLGAVPHPATGQRSVDLDTGKYWLDVLGMIKEKTSGNLHQQESRLLEGLLADLRMQYVAMVRATEEKLKAQAAKKFSGADILGKK